MKYTKEKAKRTIKAFGNMTCFFNESMTQNEMYELLRYRMKFEEAETRVIIAALVISGAKFMPT